MSKGTIKLGLMPPLTGLVGIYGTEIVHAARIACQQINNQGGVLGLPLELIIEDDGSLPESAVSAAERLVNQHQCSAIIGNLLSNSRIAVAYRVAEPSKIPLLNFSFYEGSIFSHYFFHFAALPNQQIDKMIPYMLAEHGSRMFFAGNNYEWPRGSIHAAKLSLEQAGGKTVGEEYTPVGVDIEIIDRLLDNVEAAAPDVFVPYFAGSDQVLLLTRFTERGLKKKMAVVMGHYDEMMASQLTPEVRDGFYSSNTYFMSIDSAENHDYLKRLDNLADVNGIWPQGNGILTNFGEGTYACVMAFAKAANKAGSIDAESLVKALKTTTITTPQGLISMHPEHHHATVNTYLSRCDAQGNFNIIEKFGAIEAAIPARYNHQRINNQATLEDDIRLQARILEQMSESVILVSNKDSTIVYNNAGAETLFGYDKGEMIGIHFDMTSNHIVKIIGHSGEWKGDIQHVKKDGTPLWCFMTICTFTHPAYGEVWLVVQRDISSQKHAELELALHRNHLEQLIAERTSDLALARDAANEANNAKSAFLSHMSHELRTPLNAILGFGQILAMDSEELNETQLDNVNDIINGGHHLLGLINEILDLTIIEAGQIDISIEETNLDEILQKSIALIQPQTRTRKITLVDHVSGADYKVEADPGRLKQVFLNLLSNAVKYNNEEGSITLDSEITNNGRLRISISDTGTGLSENEIAKLFSPFERLNKTDIEGTGIGLVITKSLVELMGGTIGVKSDRDVGSTFWVELVLSQDRLNEHPDKESQQGYHQ